MRLGFLGMQEKGLGLDSGVWKRGLTGPCVTVPSEVQQKPELFQGNSPQSEAV